MENLARVIYNRGKISGESFGSTNQTQIISSQVMPEGHSTTTLGLAWTKEVPTKRAPRVSCCFVQRVRRRNTHTSRMPIYSGHLLRAYTNTWTKVRWNTFLITSSSANRGRPGNHNTRRIEQQCDQVWYDGEREQWRHLGVSVVLPGTWVGSAQNRGRIAINKAVHSHNHTHILHM